MLATSDFAGYVIRFLPAIQPAAGDRRRQEITVAMTVTDPPFAGRTVRCDPYEVLRVKVTASAVEIKAAYRALAKQFHPDVVAGGSNGSEFLEIQQAYATLSDPGKREHYNRSIRPAGFGVGFRFGDGQLRNRRWETDQCW